MNANSNPSFWKKLTVFYNKTDYIKPLLVLCFFIFSVIFLNFYFTDAEALANSDYTYYFVFFLFLLSIGIYFYRNPYMVFSLVDLVSRHTLLTILFVLTFILFSSSVYLFLTTANSNTYYVTGKLVDTMTVVIIFLVTIGLIYNFIHNAHMFQRGWIGVIGEILMYLPCKIEEIMVWLAGEIANTPRVAYVILAIEIILILLIFYYQRTLDLVSINQKIFPVYGGYLYLKNETPVTSYSTLASLAKIPTLGKNDRIPMNFGISFWMNLNDNSQRVERELPVFCYGGGDKSITCSGSDSSTNPYANQNVHPAITFIPTHNQTGDNPSENLWQGSNLKWNMGHLKIYFSDCSSSDNSTLIDVPLQKWNFIAINYTSQKSDVFLNGELVASHTFSKPPIYNLGDSIKVGGDNMHGSIQDIQYSTLPFSNISVNMTYNKNLFMGKILPTFILR